MNHDTAGADLAERPDPAEQGGLAERSDTAERSDSAERSDTAERAEIAQPDELDEVAAELDDVDRAIACLDRALADGPCGVCAGAQQAGTLAKRPVLQACAERFDNRPAADQPPTDQPPTNQPATDQLGERAPVGAESSASEPRAEQQDAGTP